MRQVRMGGAHMSKKSDCSACGVEYKGDVVSRGAFDCRICYRIGCDQCLDEMGHCVPCDEKGEKKG